MSLAYAKKREKSKKFITISLVQIPFTYLQAEHAEQAVQAQQASKSLSSKTSSLFCEKGTTNGSKTSILGSNSSVIVKTSPFSSTEMYMLLQMNNTGLH